MVLLVDRLIEPFLIIAHPDEILMKKLWRLTDYFIPEKLQDLPFKFSKARTLVLFHFFLVITGSIAALAQAVTSIENAYVSLPLLLISGSVSLIYFKLKGNLWLGGNILSAILMFMLAPSVIYTGGLLSDNLVWLILVPLSALLFSDKKSGFFWLGKLLVFTGVVYVLHQQNFISSQANSDTTYFFVSYSFLFIFTFGTVFIFEMGQTMIIQRLREQKRLLKAQKQEITEKNDALEAIEIKLRLTNSELENFAFAASHDLKEPLRMIKMYTQLTQKRLLGHTDKNIPEYMFYVTDGVSRMQTLLDDLLQYSRLGKSKQDDKEVDLNTVLSSVMTNLKVTMSEQNVSVTANSLPSVWSNPTEMSQLFQNLMANAIKFRRKDVAPEIVINAKDQGSDFLFSLKDNGIGIKEEYQEKVFNIFEKLHTRVEYDGSGIGLATCKKIIQAMDGKIWLQSKEGVGTTFFFTIPKLKPIVETGLNLEEFMESKLAPQF